jgi:hypothetical protein
MHTKSPNFSFPFKLYSDMEGFYSKLPKSGRTSSEAYAYGLHATPEDLELLQYILGTVYMEQLTEKSGGQLPLLKHPSSPEFLEAAYRSLKLLFAQHTVPGKWYERARTEIATRCKETAQKTLKSDDPSPESWFRFWESRFAGMKGTHNAAMSGNLGSVASSEKLHGGRLGKNTKTEESGKRGREIDLTDDDTDIEDGSRSGKKVKMEESRKRGREIDLTDDDIDIEDGSRSGKKVKMEESRKRGRKIDLTDDDTDIEDGSRSGKKVKMEESRYPGGKNRNG